MAIQVIAPTSRQTGEQLALLQILSGAANQGAQNYLGYKERQQTGLDQKALAEVLAGTPGQGPKDQRPNAMAQLLSGGPKLGAPQGPPTASTPGLVPGLSQPQALAMVRNPEMIPLVLPEPKEGFTLSPGAVRYDAAGRQVASAPASDDISTAAKEARDLGFDLLTPEGRAAYSQYRQSLTREPVGTTVNVGADKPVTGPAAIALAQAPGAMAEVDQMEAALFPGGAFDRTVALKMADPTGTTDEAALDDVFSSGIMIILRGESGGVINQGEIDQKKAIYQPSATDSDTRAKAKMARFKRDLKNTLGVAEIGRSPAGKEDVAPVLPETPGAVSGAVNSLIQKGAAALGIDPAAGIAGSAGQAVSDMLAQPAAKPPPIAERVPGQTYRVGEFDLLWDGSKWQ